MAYCGKSWPQALQNIFTIVFLEQSLSSVKSSETFGCCIFKQTIQHFPLFALFQAICTWNSFRTGKFSDEKFMIREIVKL